MTLVAYRIKRCMLLWLAVLPLAVARAGDRCDAQTPFNLSLLAPAVVEGEATNRLDVFLPPGVPFGVDVTVYLENRTGDVLPLWTCAALFSVSVTHDPALLRLDGVGFEGTDYDSTRPRIGIAGPADPASGAGFVAADALCQDQPGRIELRDRISLVRARYSLVASPGVDRVGETITTRLRFQDGLSYFPGGPPVTNSATLEGVTVEPCLRDLEVRFHVRPLREFVRGDANLDRRLNVSDPVAILLLLFAPANAALHCRDAADVDDDGGVDIGDAVDLLRYLFVAGPAPSRPFPGAGPDPTPDDLHCVER